MNLIATTKEEEKLWFMTGNSSISLHRARLCKFTYACFLNLQVPLLCGSIHFCLIICLIEFGIFLYCEFKCKKNKLKNLFSPVYCSKLWFERLYFKSRNTCLTISLSLIFGFKTKNNSTFVSYNCSWTAILVPIELWNGP